MDLEICRLCLVNSGSIQIFSPQNNELNNLDEKIMFCAKIRIVDDDDFPKLICNECLAKLEAAYYFRIQVENADYKLRNNEKYLKNCLELPIVTNNFTTASCDDINSCDNVELDMTEYLKLPVKAPENEILEIVSKTNISDVPTVIVENVKPRKINRKKKLYQCDTCGKIFCKTNQLKVHIRTHTGEKPFSCNVCGKTFAVNHHLQGHLRVHNSEKPYQCLICGKCFSESSSLNRHTKIHKNEKNYSCSHCSKKFISPGEVRKHLVSHTGEKPYSCTICNKKYSHPSSMSKHNRKHKQNASAHNNIK